VGKDTIVSRLLESDPNLVLSRSWTTRARRPSETDESYNFVDRDTFMAHADGGGFLEWKPYLDHLYGTPYQQPPAGKDLVLVIEVQGAQEVLEKVPDAVMIFIVPPSQDAQADRLRARGDNEEQVRRRLASGVDEQAVGRRIAHHIVVNDDLDRAVGEVAGILASHRNRFGDP
jgi:guanylate kinase